jgi:hypothetical protein
MMRKSLYDMLNYTTQYSQLYKIHPLFDNVKILQNQTNIFFILTN